MGEMVACPDCGTPNKTDADLCAQCWHALSDDLISKIPVAAFAAPGHVAPPPPAAPRRIPAPRPAPEPVRPREAEPGPVPYFAPAGGCAAPAAGLPVPAAPLGSTATSKKVPWGGLIALTVVLALLGGGYYFFFGRSSGAFSPEDGSYSVVLPEGWVPIEELDVKPGLDTAVESGNEQSAIMLFHYPIPGGVTKEQMQAGMSFAQQFMPRFPGLTLARLQESTALTGEGVTAFEMSGTVSQGIVPGTAGGKMRFVFGADESSPNLVMLVVACAQAECPTAEATFLEMAQTFEFSG